MSFEVCLEVRLPMLYSGLLDFEMEKVVCGVKCVSMRSVMWCEHVTDISRPYF